MNEHPAQPGYRRSQDPVRLPARINAGAAVLDDLMISWKPSGGFFPVHSPPDRASTARTYAR